MRSCLTAGSRAATMLQKGASSCLSYRERISCSAKDKATKNFENYKQMIIYNIFFYGILIYKI